MDPLDDVRLLLDRSSDPENPSAEALRDLFASVRRIAVVGLSRSPAKAARRVPAYLASRGYDIVPVNPNAERLLGRQVYDRLEDVPGEVDMVVVFRPPAEAGAIVREAAARPERPAIWLQQGIRADEEAGAARAAGLTVVQDLCTYLVDRALRS